MVPEYNDGDFVIVSKFPFVIKGMAVGDDIVFFHKVYGHLIKRITIINSNGEYSVKGINPDSIDSIKIGLIQPNEISGKIIFHIRKS